MRESILSSKNAEPVRRAPVRQHEIGVIVPANILAGEVENGEPAGLSPHYSIRGLGMVPIRTVYPQLADACRPTDRCWAAEVTGYDPAPQPGCSCAVCEEEEQEERRADVLLEASYAVVRAAYLWSDNDGAKQAEDLRLAVGARRRAALSYHRGAEIDV